MSNCQEAIDHLLILGNDADASKSFKIKTEAAVKILQSDTDMAIDKALLELEELNSLDLSSYHRTQIWDVISLLESLK
ncbi:MAG TPA: hypothetical protein VJI98_01655 [Candidatus Nanoarchaeia archaeon]|nr:hypothetical protein [Candidatus Nanoarchaeia archaeon]